MKDPKVADMVKELRLYVANINKLNVKLYKQGVSYRIDDGYSEELSAKQIEIQYLQQKVEY
jgi:hypothetical protein